jgi:DNA mismatch repair protein MutL
MSIQVLSDQLASQIAAGEVVERPSSVVKELVENALDAGARNINVDTRNGGRELIQVADDGSGIDAADVETAFRRHATSKLESVDDLNAIGTLGFRGEALAAIAAVSRLTAVSRTGQAPGIRLTLDGGRKTGRETVGAAQGTVIAVENLFYNVPARLKFLKSITTEKRLIDEFVTRYALAYPVVRFRLAHDGRITFQSSGNGSLMDALVAVYGVETARELLALADPEADSLAMPAIRVRGFAGPPSLHWANRSHITLFVNGRWIRDTHLTYATIQAYHTLLPTGRYPMAVLFISLPPEQVDVNVHPTKIEVRFREARAVFSAVQRAVRQTLLADSPVRSFTHFESLATPGWGGKMERNAFSRREDDPPAELPLSWRSPYEAPVTAVETEPVANGHDASSEPLITPPATPVMPVMRVVGQVGASYIISEGPDGLFLIDQHAAHERILYEQFLAEWGRDGVARQALVTGTAVHLTPAQATLLNDHLPLLAQIGFDVEAFGPNAFMIREVPALVAHMEPARALMDVVEDLERGDRPLQDKIEARVIKRVCKSAAVKAGQTLSASEMEAMIRQLEACQNPHTCPHGRPTLIHLSVAQLARVFGRTS